MPSRNTGRGTCNCWVGSIFADPDQFVAVQNSLGSSSIDIQWVYPLAVGGLGADGTQALLDDLNRAGAVPLGLTGVFAPAVSTAAVAVPLVPVLSGFLVTQAAVQTVLLLLLFVSLIVTGAAPGSAPRRCPRSSCASCRGQAPRSVRSNWRPWPVRRCSMAPTSSCR